MFSLPASIMFADIFFSASLILFASVRQVVNPSTSSPRFFAYFEKSSFGVFEYDHSF